MKKERRPARRSLYNTRPLPRGALPVRVNAWLPVQHITRAAQVEASRNPLGKFTIAPGRASIV